MGAGPPLEPTGRDIEVGSLSRASVVKASRTPRALRSGAGKI